MVKYRKKNFNNEDLVDGDPGMAITIINKNGIGNKSIINRALITLLLIVIAWMEV